MKSSINKATWIEIAEEQGINLTLSSTSTTSVTVEEGVTDLQNMYVKNAENTDQYLKVNIDSVSGNVGSQVIDFTSANLSSTPTQINNEGAWAESGETTVSYKPKEYSVDITSTSNSLVLSENPNSKNVSIYNGSNTFRGVLGNVVPTRLNSFAGYPVEYNYFNNYYQHNMTQRSSPNPIGEFVDAGSDIGLVHLYAQLVMTSKFVYVIGKNILQVAPVDNDGVIGTWSLATNQLPDLTSQSQTIITKNRIYILDKLQMMTAPILSDGTVGVWEIIADPYEEIDMRFSQVALTINRVYILGAGADMRVFTAPINDEGIVGLWEQSTNPLPQKTHLSHCVITKNYAYMIGGYSQTTQVSIATIDSDGIIGTWANANNDIPIGAAGGSTLMTKNRVYLIGGSDRSVMTAPIDDDGLILDWELLENFIPEGVDNPLLAVTKNNLYLINGSEKMYVAPFADGWSIDQNSYISERTVFVSPIDSTSTGTDFGLTSPPTKAFNNETIDVSIGLEETQERTLVLDNDYITVGLTSTNTLLESNDAIVTGEKLIIEGVEAVIGTVTGTAPYSVDISAHGLTTTPRSAYRKKGTPLVFVSSTASEYVGTNAISGLLRSGDVISATVDGELLEFTGSTIIEEAVDGLFQYTISAPFQIAPTDAKVMDRSIPVAGVELYNPSTGNFDLTTTGFTKGGRFLQRKIGSAGKDMTVVAPLITQLYKDQ